MRKMLWTLLATLLVVTGCSQSDKTTDNSKVEENGVKVETNNSAEQIENNETKMPERMPSDFNFKVSFGYGDVSKNVIDTYSGTVTKDLIMKGTAVADIALTTAELQDIYNKMREINIMGSKKLTTKEGCFRTPSNTETWQITVNGETKTMTWTDKTCSTTKDTNELLELRQFIQQIVESKDEYKRLPQAEGGYD